MTTAVPAFVIPSIASGKEPTAIGVPVATQMPNVQSARPVYTVAVIPAPAFSNLHTNPAIGYPF